MRHYRYKALSPGGQVLQGMLTGLDSKDVRQQLHQKGLWVLWCRRNFSCFQKRVPLQDLVLFFRHMQYTLGAGLDVMAGLQSFITSLPRGFFKKLLGQIEARIQGGESLFLALRTWPHVFSPLVLSLVRVGEETGRVVPMYQHLAEHLSWQSSFEKERKKLLRYPLLLVGFSLLVACFLFTTVVPELLSLQQVFAPQAPPSLLLGVSLFFKEAGVWVLLGLAVFIGVASLLIHRVSSLGLLWHGFLLKVPGVRRLILSLELSSFTETLSLLVQEGFPLPLVLHQAARGAKNLKLRQALEIASRKMQEGSSLSKVLKETGFFPATLLLLLQAGEQGSALKETAGQAKAFYDQEKKRYLDTVNQLLPPLFIVVLGGFLVALILLVFYPLYEGISSMAIGV